MDLLIAAPFLRGLALAEAAAETAKKTIPKAGHTDDAGQGLISVTASPLGETLPADAVLIDLSKTDDESALQEALRTAATAGVASGVASGLKPDRRSYALRQDGKGILLTATTSDPGAKLSSGRVGGKLALVTGGAQGFGEEIVRSLVADGATVFIADLNKDGAEKLASELNTSQGRTAAYPLIMDVSNEDSVAGAFDVIARTTGGLDLVVSNAGVLKAGSVLEQSMADFEFVTKVNYTAFFLVAKYAGRMMKRQNAGNPDTMTDIIQINSKSGLEGSNKNGAYAGSKFGGIGLVQSFALELVEHGIKVNAICPGNFFDGPLWSDPDRGLFVQYLRTGKVPGAKTIADVKAFYEAKVPMRRGCEGPDVIKAIFYLVDQLYETGQALPVTGGQVMLN
ncbi:MAG: SDR family NAD(P)-dependent oxidoreductase [Clostridia bacterium]|jgi:NAD(P)-dependent dehydrogenase (short-subunit alcohol dehydrogenase family)